jgi:hypothetical protein
LLGKQLSPHLLYLYLVALSLRVQRQERLR